MERIERLGVQAVLARSLFVSGTDANMRIALILLDSAAETFLVRSIQMPLYLNDGLARLVESGMVPVTEIDLLGSAADEADNVFYVLTVADRKKLDRDFTTRFRYLAYLGDIPRDYARAFTRLHQYRNKVYHDDELRLETLRTTVGLYLFLVSELFRLLKPIAYRIASASEKLRIDEALGLMPGAYRGGARELTDALANRLVEGFDLNDSGIGHLLSDNASARISDVESSLSFIADVIAAPVRPSIADVIRIIQYTGKQPASLERIRSKSYPISVRTIAAWRAAARAIAGVENPISAFNAFAAFEESFETFESLVDENAANADRAIQEQIDWMRGK